MATAKLTHLREVQADILKGGGQWPPPSPWIWQDSWWNAQGAPRSIVLTFRFDDTNTGGGTLAFQGCDYDLDPQCPWEWLIVVRSDGVRITHQIPRTARTGTITAAQLSLRGLNKFTDIQSITVGATPN